MKSPDAELSTEEVENRIMTAVSLVHDLFGQLHNFYRLILEVLSSVDMDVKPLTRKFFTMPKRKGDPPATTYCKSHLGLVAELAAASGDEPEEDGPDEEDEDEGGEKGGKKGLDVGPDSQFLVIKSILSDAKNPAVRPCVVAAILSSLRLKGTKDGKIKTGFKVKRKFLLSLTDEVKDDVTAEGILSRKIPKYDLSCKITAVKKQSLAKFESEEDVSKFVNDILSHAG